MKSNWLAHCKNTENSEINLICFSYAGGSASFFAPWGRFIPEGVGLAPVLYPMRELRMFEPMVETIPQLADMISDEKQLFEKDFIMFSHCTGSLVAYETARRVYEKYGISPKLFATASEPSPRETIVNRAVFDMDDKEFTEYSISLGLLEREMTENEDFMKYYFPVFKADFLMHQRYDANTPAFMLDCPVMALRGSDDSLSTTKIIQDWSYYTKHEFDYKEFPGGHFFIDKFKGDIINMIFDMYNKTKEVT